MGKQAQGVRKMVKHLKRKLGLKKTSTARDNDAEAEDVEESVDSMEE